MKDFTKAVLSLIQKVPEGKVATYGQIAHLAGNRKGARQVSRILHSMSNKYNLPWHRIVNAKGNIVIKQEESQKVLLKNEDVRVNKELHVDLGIYQWDGGNSNTEWMEG